MKLFLDKVVINILQINLRKFYMKSHVIIGLLLVQIISAGPLFAAVDMFPELLRCAHACDGT